MWAKDNALDSYVRVNLVGGWLSGFQGNLVSGSVGVGGGWETWVERIWWLTRSRFKTDQFVALHFLHAMLRTNCILVWSKKRVKAVFLYWLGKTWFSKCSNRSTPNLLPPWQGRVIKDKGELWCLGRRWVGLLVVVVVGKMVLKKWDSVLLFLVMLTTIWQLSENYLATIWQLFENCLTTFWTKNRCKSCFANHFWFTVEFDKNEEPYKYIWYISSCNSCLNTMRYIVNTNFRQVCNFHKKWGQTKCNSLAGAGHEVEKWRRRQTKNLYLERSQLSAFWFA